MDRSFLTIIIWIWNSAIWGSCQGGSLGTEFITSYLQNSGTYNHFALQITGYFDFTLVTVSISCRRCPRQESERRVTVHNGMMVNVVLPSSVEIINSTFFSNIVRIQANKEISVVSLSSKHLSTDIALLYPVSSLGKEYYVVTPSSGTSGTLEEFSIITLQGPNVVDIYLKGQVTLNRKTHPAGSKLVITLNALEGVQLQGTGNLSGTRIVSQKPVAVLAGHTCCSKTTRCKHVFEQLLPVSCWGKVFVVPPLPWQRKNDRLYVSASQSTVLHYKFDKSEQTANLNRGEILPILVSPNDAIYLSASAPVQVLLYNTGATLRAFTYGTSLIGIPDTEKYSLSYSVHGQQGFKNFALLVANASETGGLTVDKKPLRNIKWSRIPGTEFSWGLYDLYGALKFHKIAHPDSPFGLLSVGIANMDGYGTAGAGIESAPVLSCSSITCWVGLECRMINSQPECVPSSEATCWSWGDPHYHTFDERDYDFQGTCTYTVVKTCGSQVGLTSFHIFAKNGNRVKKRMSCIETVTVEVYGYTITMMKSELGFVRVNGIQTYLPISLKNRKLQISQSGTFVALTTDFQLRVLYDWIHHLRVTITSAYQGHVCGLCGNYNGDSDDDFQTPSGSVALSATALGESWALKNRNETCWHDCRGACRPCSPHLTEKYARESSCGLITTEDSFTPCHTKVNPKPFFESCVRDMCFNEGQEQFLCDALKAYADACQREGAPIGDWRKLARCSLECPPNSDYQLCGTACPTTCVSDKADVPCPDVCVEGCQCKEGLVLSQGKCIPESSCGCLYEGRPYVVNESFWADDACRKRCICTATKEVKCTASACKASERCQVVNGIRGCYPIHYGVCSTTGSPYSTFDKHNFDLHGLCVYVFTEVCHSSPDLEEFGVYIQHEYWRSPSQPFTWAVQVNVYNLIITISKQYTGRILVEDSLNHLPYSTAGGRISMYRRGPEAVIQTDFGLIVTYNWENQVTVTVPSVYANTLCGLCGNFNGNPDDDAPMSMSNLVPSKPVFGTYNKALDPNYSEIIDPKCPGLKAIAEQQRASGQECGLIMAKDGPFRECRGSVDEEIYFRDCIYSFCQYKRQKIYALMCAAIASYATACQAAEANIYSWRSSRFCPPPCPPNSHYELCTHDCGQTCSSFYVPVPCASKCEEDCVCNESFLLSSGSCVPMLQCGCFSESELPSSPKNGTWAQNFSAATGTPTNWAKKHFFLK